MSLRSHIRVWYEVIRARFLSLLILRPDATEVISTVAAAALAIPVLRDPGIVLLSQQYAGAVGVATATTWATLFLGLAIVQGFALLSDGLRGRQLAALIAMILWASFGGLILFIAPPAADGWAYLVLAVANGWAIYQLQYHGGGDD